MRPGPSTAHLEEQRLSRATVFRGRLLTVHRDEVRLPGGGTAVREVVEHRGAVAIIPQLDDGRVVLVRQWRHAAGGPLWELPAGTREPGEDPARTAERELEEETGYRARRWGLLGRAAVSPGYSSEKMAVYLATGLVAGTPRLDSDELLDVEPFTPGAVAELIAAGEVDLKTIAGLGLAGLLPAATR